MSIARVLGDTNCNPNAMSVSTRGQGSSLGASIMSLTLQVGGLRMREGASSVRRPAAVLQGVCSLMSHMVECTTNQLVLLIEDKTSLALEIELRLVGLGYRVLCIDNRPEGLNAARECGASIWVLDRMLHGLDGLSIIEQLRGEGIKTPALVISALSSIDERTCCLKAGAHDYLVKPFAMDELAARVGALARRPDDGNISILQVGSLEMSLIDQTVRRGDEVINLRPREFKLLEYLARRPGQIVTRSMLLEGVWCYRFAPDTNVVDVHIGRLRRKIDVMGDPSLIENIRGVGFTLVGAVSTA